MRVAILSIVGVLGSLSFIGRVDAQCTADVDCPNGGTLHEARFSDDYGPMPAPWGPPPPQLAVDQFDPTIYATLHGVAVDAIELVAVEIEMTGAASGAVRFDNGNVIPCHVDWSYEIALGVEANASVGTEEFEVSIVEADSVDLPAGDGNMPPPWDYEYFFDGHEESDCVIQTQGLEPWIGTGQIVWNTLSAAPDQTSGNCGSILKSFSNLSTLGLQVDYVYCVGDDPDPPVCDAGASQTVECLGALTVVHLDGTGSYDPGGGPLDFLWSVDCAEGYFDDPTSPTPILYLDATIEGCDFDCLVTLEVTNVDELSSQCEAMISIRDTMAPEIECPDRAEVECGWTDPSFTGYPVVFDHCDLYPVVTYEDEIFFEDDCPANRFLYLLVRRWRVVDECGNSAECTQPISVTKRILEIDAIPGICPNPFQIDEECDPGDEDVCASGGKPTVLTMRYTGEDCSASQTTQDAGQWGCSGDPADESLVRIVATNKINGANIYTWFDGVVALGEPYSIDAANGGKSWLQANVHIRIYDLGDQLLQHSWFHSSCSQPLAVGDQFGANLIEGFVDTTGGSGGGGTGGGGTEPQDLVVSLAGSIDFDVTSVDLNSVELWTPLCRTGGLKPIFSTLEDVTAPYTGLLCGPCGDQAPDGWLDLSFTFDWQQVIDSLGLAGLEEGDTVRIALTGLLTDECPFIAMDCLYVDTCEPGEPGADICEDEGPPRILTVQYTGEGCSATSHQQDPGQVRCIGDPGLAPLVRVVAAMEVGGGWVWFDGMVALGETFDIDAANGGQANLKSKILIELFDPTGVPLQTVGFHTSCSQPLNVGNQFGSILITDFVND